MTNPAQEFAAILGGSAPAAPEQPPARTPGEELDESLNGPRPEVLVDEQPAGPRAPRPNHAQGTSDIGPRPPSPHAAFVAAVEAAVYGADPNKFPRNATAAEAGQYAGWHDLNEYA